jgi:hypothetical protein
MATPGGCPSVTGYAIHENLSVSGAAWEPRLTLAKATGHGPATTAANKSGNRTGAARRPPLLVGGRESLLSFLSYPRRVVVVVSTWAEVAFALPQVK